MRPHRSRSGAKGRFPLGTIAAYGPDNTFANKLVVSVIEREGQRDAPAMRTWTTQAVDVRHDPTIAAEVADFLTEYRVRESVRADRIIGCPHEEGIDYPLGRACPQCPFWAGIDRFTHEPVTLPVPTMTPAEILAELSAVRSVPPEEALESADGHRAALVEPLLNAIERGLAAPQQASEGEATLFSYALYLLAKWREPRAYASVLRWLSLPDERAFEIGGDVVCQDGARSGGRVSKSTGIAEAATSHTGVRQKSVATSRVPARAARSTRNVVALESPLRRERVRRSRRRRSYRPIVFAIEEHRLPDGPGGALDAGTGLRRHL